MATIYRFVFVGFLACFLIAGSPLRSHSGLIGYWSFDECSGDTVYDSTGYFSPGVIHGAQFTTGKVNSALLFDGADDYVEVPHDDVIYSSPSGELTIEMWVRIDETKGWIFCKAREPEDVGDIVFEFSGGRLVFGVWSGTWRHTYFNVETHKWYFIAGVIGSDYFSLYEPTVTPPQSNGQKFTPDAAFSDEGELFLRAEKSRGGDGRVYEVMAIATDASGNSDSGSVLVKVPRSRSRDAVDSGQGYNAATINY